MYGLFNKIFFLYNLTLKFRLKVQNQKLIKNIYWIKLICSINSILKKILFTRI
jgi:hypothetical protein